MFCSEYPYIFRNAAHAFHALHSSDSLAKTSLDKRRFDWSTIFLEGRGGGEGVELRVAADWLL